MSEYFPEEWGSQEIEIFVNMTDGIEALVTDEFLQAQFHTALFEPELSERERDEAYEAMVEYLYDEYEIEFDEVFDWEAYREWYENAI